MAERSPQTTKLNTTDYLRGAIRKWYPDYLRRTQCVPPLYFRRISYKWEYIYRWKVLALDPRSDSSSQATESDSGNATQSGAPTQQSGDQGQTQESGDQGQAQQSGDQGQTQQPVDLYQAALSTHKAQAGKSGQKTRKRKHARQSTQSEVKGQTSFEIQYPGPETKPGSSARTAEDMSSSVRAELPGSVSGQTAQPGSTSQAGPSGGLSATTQPAGSDETSVTASDKLPKVQTNDLRDDVAQQHVLDCFKALGDSRYQEGMFIISNLKFRQILNKTARQGVPQGELDIILVNRKHGLCIGEIKSVGFAGTTETKSVDEINAGVVRRVEKAVTQLKKIKVTMEKMTHDVKRGLNIMTTLILPYVSRAELLRAVNSDTKTLAKDLPKCLGAKDLREAIQLCLCSDDLPGVKTLLDELPKDVSKLENWFGRRFGTSADPLMSDEVYLDLIARLCGPATTIEIHGISKPRLEVHTIPEAVSATGERMMQLVLTPEQVDLLNTAPKCVWITGPPGTGKTITAVVMGLVWLKQGFDVHVVSCNSPSLAASEMIHHQLSKTLQGSDLNLSLERSCSSSVSVSSEPAATATDVEVAGKPYLHKFDFFNDEKSVDRAVFLLREFAGSNGNKLHVIIDECDIPESEKKRDRYTGFFKQMIALVSDVHMWVISVDKDHLPTSDRMQEIRMTLPLRCPPTVFRLVKSGVEDYKSCYKYTTSVCPAPCDGPPEIRLIHAGPEHSPDQIIVNCRQCGIEIAKKLRQLDVGVAPASDPSQPSNTPPPLKYGDVMILTYSSNLTQDSELMAGLESEGIPVSVLPWYGAFPSSPAEEQTIKDVATAVLDKVIIAHPFWVKGLERKVVVYLPGRNEKDQYDDADWYTWDKVQIMSRCTAQLIAVLWPGHPL